LDSVLVCPALCPASSGQGVGSVGTVAPGPGLEGRETGRDARDMSLDASCEPGGMGTL